MRIRIHPFTQSFNKYLLHAYSVLDTVLNSEDMQRCEIGGCELYETRSRKTCLMSVAEILERNDDGY